MYERIAEDEALVRSNRLQPACRSRLWDAGEAPRGVVLLLHGFTAGPWQFEELGPKLAQAGLLAYAARLPGHGATVAAPPKGAASGSDEPGGREDASGLPRSRHYLQFGITARSAWAEAKAVADAKGVPLYLVGHSAGGAMALDLLRHPDHSVRRAVLVAPLLRPKRRFTYFLVQLFGKIPLGGLITDRVRLSWPEAARRPDGWVRPGHRHFTLGNVVALFRYANRVRHTLSPRKGLREALPPLQFICTATDDKVDLAACSSLAEVVPKRHYLHCFSVSDAVPHAMLTRWENPQEHHRSTIHALVQAFLLDAAGSDNVSSLARPPALP